MNLTSDWPFWLTLNGLVRTYPPLDSDVRCECVVVGAGITGALLADRLTREGFDTVVVDGRDICSGSTSASTALLQYEIDVPLTDMIELIGEAPAQRAYQLSHDSIEQLEELVRSLNADVGFRRNTSIYLAADRKAALQLADEARARKAIGLDVTYHDQDEVQAMFHLPGVAALSSKQAASCDPYRLAHALLHRATAQGARIFDRTRVAKFACEVDGVQLQTERGPTITARYAVIATGYESQTMLKEKIVDLDNTYALVSEPLCDLATWNEDWMLWEAKYPYLYLRITDDRRLLVGGEDERFHSPAKRDASIERKAKVIEAKTRELLPALKWEPAFAWGGTFGKTKDGLAYIGPTDEYPSCYFALGFGGNGITFSAIATEIIPKLLKQVDTPDAELFRFGR
jgi:glycine/D-amino acid oxidase-like deaminating enzyme